MGKKLPTSTTELINRPFLRNTRSSPLTVLLAGKQQQEQQLYVDDETTILLSQSEQQQHDEDSISNDDSNSSDGTTIDLITTSRKKKQQVGSNNGEREQQQQQYLSSSQLRIGKLMFGVCGIYGAYLSYGMYQEDLYRYKDEQTGIAVVRCVWFLQVLESAASIALGGVARKMAAGGSTSRHVQLRPFLLSGAAQVFAKAFMSWSLVMGASFPVATLAKSAKIVPVMIGQLILGGASYHLRDYVFAILVVSGTVLLSLGKTTSNNSTSAPHSGAMERSNDTIAGIVCILLSLLMDGCVGGLQKQMKRDFKDNPPTTYDYVFFTHISMILIALGASLLTGDFWSGMNCLIQYPAVAKMVAAVCLLSVIGQSFIFFVISSFDPLVCATITTTRKIWSVLLSIAFKGYTLSSMGYAGLALAILGLGMEVDQKARPRFPVKKTKHTDQLV